MREAWIGRLSWACSVEDQDPWQASECLRAGVICNLCRRVDRQEAVGFAKDRLRRAARNARSRSRRFPAHEARKGLDVLVGAGAGVASGVARAEQLTRRLGRFAVGESAISCRSVNALPANENDGDERHRV
eukprot:CAMPEP_0181253022 /NCGR_PEP_ID=MMETSP1096-20121128/47794_1 /TAXON_ID=156174 ORGANISM="Chrysochromulina ericina, Strain CCMP281" /NCGR_SAMPLE_ID=MMETSP1096 /ASSEMBLY_ACC=CAM_ASM_000453 /LENGTH=130 /DNA_ID=CAMNT_0023350855 /DNA_START=523 /DNA_END=912 /DNA_ORIENTATION=+